MALSYFSIILFSAADFVFQDAINRYKEGFLELAVVTRPITSHEKWRHKIGSFPLYHFVSSHLCLVEMWFTVLRRHFFGTSGVKYTSIGG